MRYARLSLILLGLSATGLLADGFKIPNLNPFAKKKKSSFRLTGQPGRPSKASPWTKFTQGTKKAVNSTVGFMTPSFMKKKPQEQSARPRTGSRRIIKAKQKQKQKSKSPFSFLFPPKEEPKAGGISKFLLQERPGF